MHRRTRTSVFVLLFAMLATACAGGVGKLDSAAPPANPIGETAAAASPAGPSDVGAPGTVPATAGPTSATSRAGSGAQPSSGSATERGATSANRPGGTASTSGGSPRGPSAGQPGAPSPNGSAASRPMASDPTASGSASVASGSGVPSLPAPSGTRTGVTAGTVNVGVFFPKTGPLAGLFRNLPAVAQAAFDEAGPIHGRKLVLKTYDDGTANASTIQVEEKRAKDEAFALVSILGESSSVLAPLADQHRVPLIVGNADEKVIAPLTHAFPVLPYWARQARILPGFIQNVLGGGTKRVGVVYMGVSSAIDAKNAFKVKAKEVGLNVVFEQPIDLNQSACANEVANLQSHRVELVFMMANPLGAICMLRDARALSYKPIWTGVGTTWEANVVATASGGGAEGIRKLTAFATLETQAGRHFSDVIRKYAPNSGAAEDDMMLLVYGMLQTFIEGIRRAGPDLTREGFVHTFETAMNGYDSGYLPPPTFGPGNRSGPLAVGVVACCTNGRWSTPVQGWRESF